MKLTAADIATEEGYGAAIRGEYRAAPTEYKLLSPEQKGWYAGFDAATKGNHNPVLTRKFQQRAA